MNVLNPRKNDILKDYISGYFEKDAVSLYKEMEHYELKNIPVIICTCMSSAKYTISKFKYCACLVDETS